jgi:hypothetical protein
MISADICSIIVLFWETSGPCGGMAVHGIPWAGPSAKRCPRGPSNKPENNSGGITGKKRARRPVSRVLSPEACAPVDGHSSGTPVTGRLARPTRTQRGNAPARRHGSLFDLAPGGVCPATAVAGGAVRSYRTLSPLPSKLGGLLSVALSLRSPPPGITRHRVPVEPGLSSSRGLRDPGSGHPAIWHIFNVGLNAGAVNCPPRRRAASSAWRRRSRPRVRSSDRAGNDGEKR